MRDGFSREIDYMRVSVTDRCNLRCVYCMPEKGVEQAPHADILRSEEITRLCGCAAALGIRNIKLTGGEPLVRKGVPELAGRLKAIDGIETVTLTTNGVLLADCAQSLARAGVDAVNVSLDAADAETFRRITRRDCYDRVLEGIDAAYEALPRVKLNCLAVEEYNGGRLAALAAFAADRAIDVRFIELMPIGLGKGLTAVPSDKARALLEAEFGPMRQEDGKFGNGPAVYYRPAGFKGRIGFIAALSHAFCPQCNRVRLTSGGFLKLCLHYGNGADLRGPLRSGASDEALTELMRKAICGKPRGHDFATLSGEGLEKEGMSRIGG